MPFQIYTLEFQNFPWGLAKQLVSGFALKWCDHEYQIVFYAKTSNIAVWDDMKLPAEEARAVNQQIQFN